MISLSNVMSRFINAFIGLMLLSAALHLTTLAVYYIKTGDEDPLNFFSIIGFNLFFPQLITSQFAPLYSFIATVSLYLIVFFFFTHENRHSR